MENARYWFGKRVLVTGGDGFVASHLAARLIKHAANVVTVVRHQRPSPTLRLLGGSDIVADIEVSDLAEFRDVQRIVDRHSIDTIFHLAASAIVGDAANAPISTFENNIVPTLNILEAARVGSKKIERVVIASSDKAYGDHDESGDPEPLPYVEDFALRGLDVYSSSKVCADMIAQTYALQFDLPVVVARSCNIYGPGDLNFTRLIPRTIVRCLMGGPPVIRQGNQNVRREYIYVDDVVDAYLLLGRHAATMNGASKPKTGRATYGWCAFNIGSYACRDGVSAQKQPNVRSVQQVIEEVTHRMGEDAPQPVTIGEAENVIEIPDQFQCSDKLLALGFAPNYRFNEGLVPTVRWYRDHRDYVLRLSERYASDEALGLTPRPARRTKRPSGGKRRSRQKAKSGA
jgi:CDP-glucose 4,6-dehydratase